MTRLKSNTPLKIVEDKAVAGDGPILSDRIGFLPARQAKSRKNPYGDPVREVCLRLETGKVLRLLSNDLDSTGQDIAALYKRRWQIELFFRWVKQNLKIKSFLGASENAIRIQIAVALIVYLLLKLAHKAQEGAMSLLLFAKLVKANLMQLKRIDRLLLRDPEQPANTSQMVLECL